MNNQESVSNIIEFCRLCLSKPGTFNVFKSQGLFQDVYEFTGIKVFLSDKLPQMICGQCVMVIDNIKKLKATATKNDECMKTLARSTFKPFSQSATEKFITVNDSNFIHSHLSGDNICSDDRFESYYVKLEDISIEENEPSLRDMDYNTSFSKIKDSNDLSSETQFMIVKDSNLNHTDLNTSANQSYETYCIKTEYIEERNVPDPVCEDYNKFSAKIKLRNDVSSQTEPSWDLQSYKRNPARKNEQNDLYYRCDVCEKKFETWKKFYLHNRLHNKSIECTFKDCQKKFSSKGDLTKHLRVHTGERPYECDHCHKRFKQRVTLNSHKEAQHNKSKNKVLVGNY